MEIPLTLLLVSFIINAVILVPFINFLYRLKFQRQLQKTKDVFDRPTPIFDSLNREKVGIPIGGGLLIVSSTTILFLLTLPILYYFWVPITSIYENLGAEIKILFFTFVSFAFVGLYDDLKKVFLEATPFFFGLRLRHKLLLEVVLSTVIAFWMFTELKIEMIYLPFWGVVNLGILYIPFVIFVITAFANAFNITDGLDGLATGVLMIALSSFWVISYTILDTPLSVFIAVWLGSLIAFLYFNIYPARIFLGDAGALSFGATLAVIGLLLGKVFSLLIIGGLFVAEVTCSLVQIVSKKYRGKKVIKAAPLHLWLQAKGWHEATIVFRAWLVSIVLAIIGLWLAFLA